MIRKIKFRAWDSDHKVMRTHSDPQVIQVVILGNDYGGRVIVEQFTGLEDKFGREIYEGDILGTSNDDPEFDIWDKEDHGYTVVQWSDQLAAFRGDNWEWDVDPEEESIYALGRFVEVIGNIHQNPELIK